MSILSLRPGRTEPQRIDPIPYAPRPKPAPPGPHQLGSTTLANVETLTDLSAEEIERVADAIDEAARVESDGLREFARRLRTTGRLANEQLAAFVHVASTCAEAGKHMQAAIEKRNEVPVAEPTHDAPAEAVAAVESALAEGTPA